MRKAIRVDVDNKGQQELAPDPWPGRSWREKVPEQRVRVTKELASREVEL